MRDDLPQIDCLYGCRDRFLIMPNPPKGLHCPWQRVWSFDCVLVPPDSTWNKPWIVAGGRDADNVQSAARNETAHGQVDVSVRCESAPGQGRAGLSRQFGKPRKS